MLGILTQGERVSLMNKFIRNRANPIKFIGRNLTNSEQEMHHIKWFDAYEFLKILTDSQIDDKRVQMTQMKKGTFLRPFLIEKWQHNKFEAKKRFVTFCLGKGWDGGPTKCNASEKSPGVAGGIMPCCIEEETGRPLVLLGLE